MRSGIFGDRVGWRRWRLRNGHHAYGPGSVDDSLLVGSSRMDQGTSVESTRMFFDKATGAFRAGTASGTHWNTLGANSVAFGDSNTATGANSSTFGQGNSNSGVQGSFAIGTLNTTVGGGGGGAAGCLGYQNVCGTLGIVIGGGNTQTGLRGILAGYSSTSSGDYALTTGFQSTTTRYAQRSHAAGQFSAAGDAQRSVFVMRNSTTDATATELGLDGATAYITIGATRTMSFHIKIAAHRTDVSGTAAAWPLITGGITRDSSGNCRLLGTITGASTTSLCDAGASTWSVAVTADSTNNRLAITVTGEAAKTIRWVASVEMAEVG